MSILIIVISVIASIIILLLIIGLFLKKDYAVERQVTIQKPSQQVFSYIKQIKNQDVYSVWNQLDPAMKKTYSGTDGTVGFSYAWDSTVKKAGKGEQTIKAIKEGERIDMGLHFIRPFEGRSEAYMSTKAIADNQTSVQWGVNGKMPYPMNLMMLFMNMNKMMGKDLAMSLSNLKALMEKN